MNQAVIFSVGVVVFALTVWGVVMAGGYWLGELAASEDDRSGPGAAPSAPPPESPPTN